MKMKEPLLLVLFALIPLQAAVAAEGDPDPAAQAARNKAVARRVFDEIFNQGKFQVADEIYAPDFVNHMLRRNVSLQEDQAAVPGPSEQFWPPILSNLWPPLTRARAPAPERLARMVEHSCEGTYQPALTGGVRSASEASSFSFGSTEAICTRMRLLPRNGHSKGERPGTEAPKGKSRAQPSFIESQARTRCW